MNAGPFWIGKDSEKKQSAMSEPKTSPKARVANNAPSARVTAPVKAPLAKQPVRLRSLPMRDNWFVFVDTYDSGQRADEVISTLNGQGLDAKVAVESRSGELFYRVQIVGIENETTGNTIVSQLRADAFKNARLRKTVNQNPVMRGSGNRSSIISVFSGNSPTPSDIHIIKTNTKIVTASCRRVERRDC